jgi:hypothetical protein
MHLPPWAVGAARGVVRERASRIYLGVVAAAVLLLLLQTALDRDPQVSFGGVLLELVTLPWTPLLWRLFAAVGGLGTRAAANGWTGWALTVAAAVVSASLDAALIGYGVRAARRRFAAR